MSFSGQARRGRPDRGPAFGAACPSCGSGVALDANRCKSCGFTGADSMVMFPDPAPPLMPVLDAAGLWNPGECRKIEAARERLRRFFPQFHFHVWTVITPEDTKLPAFGFWLLNTCPFYVNETAGDRAWTVLLLLDARTCQAAVIPGYSAERWLSDEDWKKALAVMNKRWKPGKSADAVIRFFDSATALLNQSWKLLGMRRVKRSGS